MAVPGGTHDSATMTAAATAIAALSPDYRSLRPPRSGLHLPVSDSDVRHEPVPLCGARARAPACPRCRCWHPCNGSAGRAVRAGQKSVRQSVTAMSHSELHEACSWRANYYFDPGKPPCREWAGLRAGWRSAGPVSWRGCRSWPGCVSYPSVTYKIGVRPFSPRRTGSCRSRPRFSTRQSSTQNDQARWRAHPSAS
jgi:hypothetical protein